MTYSDSDGAALAGLLDGDGVGSTQVGTPVATADGDDAQLGDDDGGTDGGGNLLGGLDTETDVALRVTDDNDGLEAGTLTGTGLLLDGLDLYWGHKVVSQAASRQRWHNKKGHSTKIEWVWGAGTGETRLHDLVLELGQEEVDDLVLLDGQRVQVDLLHALDLASLYQTAELGDGLPLLLLALAAATSTAATTTTTTVATTTIAESTTGRGATTVSHCCLD